MPGTVVAVAVYTPLAWLDRRIVDGGRELLGVDVGLLFTGTILGLVVAYVVRFQALAFFSVDARMRRVDPALDDAARSLGADPNRVLADVHLPLLWPGIVTAALLVFVEVMKELPATALLRPLGGDTLAIAVWEATRDSRFEVAALPALLIVAVGLVPVVLAIRSSRSDPGALIGPGAGGDGLDEAPGPRLVQEEAGGVEHVAVAQARQPADAQSGFGSQAATAADSGSGLRPLVSGSSKAWRSHARSSAMRRGRGASASGCQGSSSRRRSGTPGGRVSATPRAASQSG